MAQQRRAIVKINERNGWLVRKGTYTFGNYTISEHLHGPLRRRAYDLRVDGVWRGRYSTLQGAQKAVARRERQLELA